MFKMRYPARIKQAREILGSGFKQCTHCRETKRIEEFYKDSRQYHGLQPCCKRCSLAENKKRKLAQKHELLERFGWRCQICGKFIGRDTKYARHHLSNFPLEEITALLCKACHDTLHTLRIRKIDMIREYGNEMAPYYWAKKVIRFYEDILGEIG